MAKEKKELTEKQKLFLEALFSDEAKGNPVFAKKMAGYSDNNPTSDIIEALSEEIVERAKKVLATNSGKAVYALLNILDNPSSAGAMNKLKAAQEILNRAGVKEKESNSIEVPMSGIVILPAKSVTVETDEG